ncbi:MAG: AIR synthase related protein [Terriglobales bacterium]
MVVTFVLEAGLPTELLEAEVRAMANAARKAGVKITGGDTKVVEHGKADRMYITTTGIGSPLRAIKIDPRSVKCGDKVLLSGPIGDHGITILLARGELDIEAGLRSDTRSVLPLVEVLAAVAAPAKNSKSLHWRFSDKRACRSSKCLPRPAAAPKNF